MYQGQAELAPKHGERPQRRDRVHGAPGSEAQDDLGAEDREAEAVASGPGAKQILLLPVEIRVVPMRRDLSRGNTNRHAEVGAVGLGALEQCHVLEARQGVERAFEHAPVALDLVRIEPAPDQLWLLVERRIDEVRRVAMIFEFGTRPPRVPQVNRQRASAALEVRRPARERDHRVIAAKRVDPLHDRTAHHAERPGHDDPSRVELGPGGLLRGVIRADVRCPGQGRGRERAWGESNRVSEM